MNIFGQNHAGTAGHDRHRAPLAVLDLAPISEGSTAAQALRDRLRSYELLADTWGIAG